MSARAEPLLHYLRRLTTRSATDTDDAALLKRFVSGGDESAFAALLARHGPMVLGVCRRVLRDTHEAEDAFQATFLVLARKAGSLRRPERLASWLYGTARHLASNARRGKFRRRQHESLGLESVAPASSGDPLDDLSARELLLALDEELARLPGSYRLPLILCHLEGHTHEEAARLLGLTSGSVKGRLERGRARLRARLVRRGLALSAGLLAWEGMATSPVSAKLRQATVQKVFAFAVGKAEGIAAHVLALAESGVTSVTLTKPRLALILLLALGFAGGTGVLAYQLRNEKQAEEKRAAMVAAPERKTETPKPAREKHQATDPYGDPLPSGAIARLGTVRFRHGGWLRDVLISPDGSTLISSGSDSIELWDAQSGRRRRQITSASPSFCSIDLSPDGKLLAVANSPNKMRFWDLASGTEVHPFGDAAPVAFRVAFSPDGKWMATEDAKANQRTISLWDFRARKKIRVLEAGQLLDHRSLAFSPNSQMLAFPGVGGVRVWDVAADKEVYQLDLGTKAPVGCVAFSFDGKLLAAAICPNEFGSKNAIHLWDVATGKKMATLEGHEFTIVALAMSPKSNRLASASWDGTIRFWDLETRKELGKCPGPRGNFFTALAFSADGSMVVSGETRGVIRLWDARTRQEIPTPAMGANCIGWVAFSPDGQTLISTVKDQLGLWEALTGRNRRIFHTELLADPHPTLSADGKNLATVDGTNGQALLWEAATGRMVRRFGKGGQRVRISSCAISSDGRRLALAFYSEGIIYVWDVASGKEIQQLKGHRMIGSLALAPDGATMVSASTDENNSDYTVRLWNIATGKEIWRKATRPWTAFDVKFSPDGRTLALVGGMFGRQNSKGEVRLWDASSGKELRRCEGHREWVGCVEFSPDGRMLATGGKDHTIRLWEIATGLERERFQGHQQMISAVSFSPDGRLLASASDDTTALVWDLTGRFRDGRFRERRLSAEELNRCWNDLAGSDAARAYRSIRALIGSPKETTAFLKDHLRPVTAADPRRVKPLLAALDSEQFAERDKAAAELEQLGLAVEPALRAALDAKPSLEVRRRIEAVLDKLAGGPRLRFLRALEVLEQIATPEARQVLTVLSQGAAEMWPTQEAKAALARLRARPTIQP